MRNSRSTTGCALAERVRSHPFQVGLGSDLAPATLDVVDLPPGAVPGREDRVDGVDRSRDQASPEDADGELGETDGSGGGQVLAGTFPCVSVLTVPLMTAVRASSSISDHRRASTSPMRAPVASMMSMMSAMSPDDFGPGRSAVIQERTASRALSTSVIVRGRAAAAGRLMLNDPRTGFDAMAPSPAAASSIAPVTTFALR